ncbi:MAG: glutamate--tRNA ligase, partial [Casimicrobiaceae bacterium]
MIRTRFAPSPTGYLHLGGARTALFAWAFARHHQGTFILRIEDTDVERSTPAAVQAILDAMAWLELDYDEGPIFQMQRMDRYRAVVADLLERGLAYRDYMSSAELDALRADQMARGEKPRYDGRWRPENAAGKAPPADVKPVIRFRNPDTGTVAWDDGVKGRIEIANAELDDLVIARGDGTPTYNFCAAVDDWDMRITHVIRGDDHVNNTPRQLNILNALGAQPPEYAHVPTVLGEDGAKLSKRHGAVGVMEYAAAGYLPEAMINFLARIGWAHGDAEVFSRAELVDWFELRGISPAPSRFNAAKLNWVNQEHMKRMPEADLGQRLVPYLKRAGLDPATGPDAGAVATLLRDRADTLVAMADAAWYFYSTPAVDPDRVAEQLTPANRAALAELHGEFATLPWTREALAAAIKAAAARHALKPGQVMMPLRFLVAGTPTTPAIDAVLGLLGRD